MSAQTDWEQEKPTRRDRWIRTEMVRAADAARSAASALDDAIVVMDRGQQYDRERHIAAVNLTAGLMALEQISGVRRFHIGEGA